MVDLGSVRARLVQALEIIEPGLPAADTRAAAGPGCVGAEQVGATS